MGRAPCCDKANVKKGPWSPEEDAKLKEYIDKNGTGGNWIALPQKAGLRRCGKSCRLRWLNYLRPNIKHGEFSDDEDRIICSLYHSIGSRWSIIATQLPGRTDNDIKNYWNTKLKKKLMGISSSQKISPPNYKTNSYPSISLLQSTNSPVLSSSPYSSPSSALSSVTSANNCYTPTPGVATSFTGYEMENISLQSSFLNSPNGTSTSAIVQTQDSLVLPMHNYQVKGSLLNFGGDQASCSSSDGSCSNQFSRGREAEYDYGFSNNGGEYGGLETYVYNGIIADQNKFTDVSGNDQKTSNCCYGEINPLDYSLEEIKELISTNHVPCSSLNFFVDEIKTEEKVVYY